MREAVPAGDTVQLLVLSGVGKAIVRKSKNDETKLVLIDVFLITDSRLTFIQLHM